MASDPSAEFRALRQQTGVTFSALTNKYDVTQRVVERWEGRNTPRPEALEYLRRLFAEDNAYLKETMKRIEKMETKIITLHKYRGAGHYYAVKGREGVLSWERRERREQRLISLLSLEGYEIEFDYYGPA